MSYYLYRQNNSGGFFTAPAYQVIVKANDYHEANAIAEANGVYFDSSRDCPCCGSRWYKAFEYSNKYESLSDIPEAGDLSMFLADEDEIPTRLVIEQ